MPTNIVYTYQIVKEFIENKGCELISTTYQNCKTDLEIKCECGNIFFRSFDHFKNSKQRNCKKCRYIKSSKSQRKSFSEVKTNIEITGCDLLSTENDYKNIKSKLHVKCKDCDNTFLRTYEKVVNQKQFFCSECTNFSRSKKHTRFFQSVKDEIDATGCVLLSTEYISNNDPLHIKCKECNSTFYRTLSVFQMHEAYYCDVCSKHQSKDVRKVEEYLKFQKFNYEKEFRFSDCRGKKYPLPFDFAIFKEDGSINFLIEHMGEQHFTPKECFGGEEAFKKTLINDDTKVRYCEENEIDLYYTYPNIDPDNIRFRKIC